jgi:arabinogalactan endo-1,4-beta-galactosidase
MSHAQLVKAVFEYTKQTMGVPRGGCAAPDMVQIGNEVINGMLWPDGRLPDNWDNFADLVKAGVAGWKRERRWAAPSNHDPHRSRR